MSKLATKQDLNKIIERGKNAELEFQDFLKKNKLSSHFWIFAKN